MECERCHRERAAGRTYEFHYGTKGQRSSYVELGGRVTVTPYDIAGKASVWIGDRCVNLRQAIHLAFLLLIFAVVAAGVYALLSEGNVANTVCWGALLLIGLAWLSSYVGVGQRTDVGEEFAIGVRKKALKRQGYDAFLTTRQFKRLR